MAQDWAEAEYLVEAKLEALAKKRGWKTGESLWDYAEDYEATELRKFPNKQMAQGWAQKNAALDMHKEPRVRLMQDGEFGPELVDEWVFQDGQWFRISE